MENETTNDYFRLNPKWIRLLRNAAIFSFGLGLIFLVYYTYDYSKVLAPEYSMHFDHKNGLEDLAGVLLGTTGLMWSLTATLLFVYTIFQTREQIYMQQMEIKNQVMEMKTSNETFKKQYELSISQQYRTTFFSLIESHSKLLSTLKFQDKDGLSALNAMYLAVIAHDTNYSYCINNHEFRDSTFTTDFIPYRFMREEGTLKSLVKHFYAMIKYVEEFLYSDKFFFEILENSLSVSEKQLIDVYCRYYNNSYTENLRPYSGFLESKNFYVPTFDRYFPSIELNFVAYMNIMIRSGKLNDHQTGNFHIKKLYDAFDESLVLHSIEVEIFKRNEKIFEDEQIINKDINSEYEFTEGARMIDNFMMKLEIAPYEEIDVFYKIHFMYGNVKYSINKKLSFQKYLNNESDYGYNVRNTYNPPRVT